MEILDVAFRVGKFLQELEAIFETGENCKLALKRILPEVKVENGRVFRLARLPIRVRHRQLVQIREKRLNHG